MTSRKCARPGCRAWAMRGGRYCSAHRQFDTATASARDRRADSFVQAVRAGQTEDLLERTVRQVIADLGADRSLQQEIGALRIVLQRVLAVDALEGDLIRTASTATRLVETIIRAVRAQRLLSDEMVDSVASALTTVLVETGLGEDGE